MAHLHKESRMEGQQPSFRPSCEHLQLPGKENRSDQKAQKKRLERKTSRRKLISSLCNSLAILGKICHHSVVTLGCVFWINRSGIKVQVMVFLRRLSFPFPGKHQSEKELALCTVRSCWRSRLEFHSLVAIGTIFYPFSATHRPG